MKPILNTARTDRTLTITKDPQNNKPLSLRAKEDNQASLQKSKLRNDSKIISGSLKKFETLMRLVKPDNTI